MADETPTATATPPAITAAPAAAAPQLTVADLTDTVKLIDVASRRGAFEGAELIGVGTLRQKFVDFVQVASQAKPATPPTATAAPAA